MKKFLLIAAGIILPILMMAQPPGGFQGRQPGNQNMNAGHFYGKIVDSKTNKGIDAATIQLIGNRFDTAAKKIREIILATILTHPNGDFSLENLPVFGNFKLHVSVIGYKDYTQQISFDLKSGKKNDGNNINADQQDRMQQVIGMIDKDLGNIKIEASDANLENVTVSATTKPFFEMGVDRKIFNVDKNIVSAGQTATEVMKQIPSLNVDIDGNVTLRNATPQLFVDGRPTTLTLDQIPADIIDKVELITNPSAKFDASGGNAGILNIVLKKNVKTGYNGGIRAGVDSRAKINVGGDINFRQNKLNFFLNGVYNQRKSKFTSVTDRYNISDTPGYVHLNDEGISNGYFSFIRSGFDYFIDNRNTISFAGNFNRGMFTTTDDQLIDSSVNSAYISHSDRTTNSRSDFRNLGTQLSFKHNFKKNGHDLTADLTYNKSKNTNSSYYETNTFNPDNSPKYNPFLQQTTGSGETRNLVIQSDYENPVDDNHKFEAGARAVIRDSRSESIQSFFNDSTGEYIDIPSISNNYKFTDEVYAAYATYTFKTKKWNYQLGLRAESSNYDGTLLGKDSSFKVNYPISFFPSAFITYRIADKQDFQLNYSRRINRPNFFQILPFVDYSDPQNLNVGNPALKPAFTNSLELSYDKGYSKNASFLATVYFKYSTDLITRYQYIGTSPVNPADTVVFNTYANANNSISYGLELTNKNTIAKIWDLTLNFNLYNSKINGTNLENDLTNQQVSWFAKWNNNIKLPNKFSVQFSGNYQSKTVLPVGGGGGGRGGGNFFGGGNLGTAQGYIFPNYSFDLALRKEWQWKGGNSASVTLSMNDIFKTAISKTYSESQYFTQVSERRRDPQVLRLNLNYRFGKLDTSLFKRKNTRADQGEGVDVPGNQ